jgi:nitrogen PTS system EIIA component
MAMKMSDFLDPQAIVSDLKATNKKEVLEELSSVLETLHPALDRDKMVGVLLDRERLGSTGVGEGVAIPHGKMGGLEGIIACFGRSTRGVEFEAVDNQPVRLFFLLFAPENSAGAHLKALAKISRLLKRPSVREALLQARSKQDLYGILTQEDGEELQASGS